VTKRQQDFITGKLLGDGSLENRGTANSRLQIRHSIRQKDYVNWCYQQLRNLTTSIPKQHKKSYYFRTKSSPVFTKLRQEWYERSKKLLPSNLSLSPYILSIWYMDDGYYDRRRDSVWLCTHCFTLNELQRLIDALIQLGIHCTKIRDRTHFKLRVISKDTQKFFNTVRPYIVPSLLYKIGIAP